MFVWAICFSGNAPIQGMHQLMGLTQFWFRTTWFSSCSKWAKNRRSRAAPTRIALRNLGVPVRTPEIRCKFGWCSKFKDATAPGSSSCERKDSSCVKFNWLRWLLMAKKVIKLATQWGTKFRRSATNLSNITTITRGWHSSLAFFRACLCRKHSTTSGNCWVKWNVFHSEISAVYHLLVAYGTTGSSEVPDVFGLN